MYDTITERASRRSSEGVGVLPRRRHARRGTIRECIQGNQGTTLEERSRREDTIGYQLHPVEGG